jgi:hypothetical protein
MLTLLKKVLNPKTALTIEPWGIVLGSDGDFACIKQNLTQITIAKTNRLPYTKDFMKALILMKEFGAAEDLSHNDSDNSWWLEALETVHATHPLISYDRQKTYFCSKPHFYMIVENGDAWMTTYKTYDQAKAAVHTKYKEMIEEDKAAGFPPACDVEKDEDSSGKTSLYIEKEIFCEVVRLPMPL